MGLQFYEEASCQKGEAVNPLEVEGRQQDVAGGPVTWSFPLEGN